MRCARTSALQGLVLMALMALMLLMAGCTTNVPVPAGPVATTAAANAAWARVLQRHVDAQGEVDFETLAREPGDLESFVRHVAATPLTTLTDGSVRLAHMINAYNALAMFNVIHAGIPATHAGWARVDFFVLTRFDIGGESMSLRAFENEVIRPHARRNADPRIHFALNCMALSCPQLPREPFSAEALDAQLERETRAFFARPQNLRIDTLQRTIWVNEVLDFYAEDFVPQPAASLLDYMQRYARDPLPAGYTLRFAPYDWTVANSRRVRGKH